MVDDADLTPTVIIDRVVPLLTGSAEGDAMAAAAVAGGAADAGQELAAAILRIARGAS